MTVHVVGVRHHSPACARRVQRVLARVKPKWVLIEGPADMNGRLGELALDHSPPVALYSSYFTDDRRLSSWCPFCVHSPEWIALREGLAMGAEVRFIDLPAWTREMRGIENRYADHHKPVNPNELLEARTGERGYDAVWDALFEIPDPEGLGARLDTYFRGIREHGEVSQSDAGREAFMARYVAWASGQGGDVVVVCGGFHQPALEDVAADPKSPEPTPPAPEEGAKHGTWLIPFDDHRLDSFTGYASGLPSPAYYRWVWELGPDGAAREGLRATAQRLRSKKQVVSVADNIGAWTQAIALARLRGHPSVCRVDLLDAVASTWIKEGLDHPLPWATRQSLPRGTHPVVVELVASLSGDVRGRLDPRTPLPPLVHSVRAELNGLGVRFPPDAAQSIQIKAGKEDQELLRVAFERLLLLDIHGVQRTSAPDVPEPSYELRPDPNLESSLLEAAAYGATLEVAAVSKLEDMAGQAKGMAALVNLLVAAVRANLPSLSERALGALHTAALDEGDLGELGQGLGGMVGMLRHGQLSDADRGTVTTVVETALDRGLWLLEGTHGDGPLDRGRVSCVAAVRDTVLQNLAPAVARVEGVLRRMALSTTAPSDLRGAALGALASLDLVGDHETAHLAGEAIDASDPSRLGDYLGGLVMLAREVMAGGLLEGIDQRISSLPIPDFELALPSLRMAFQSLPTRERADVARTIARMRGATGVQLERRLSVNPAQVMAGQVLEERATALLRQYGLLP